MMIARKLLCVAQELHILRPGDDLVNDALALRSVALHYLELILRQLAGLVQDDVRYGDFADVMEPRGRNKQIQVHIRKLI
jgi:hypothetical protein